MKSEIRKVSRTPGRLRRGLSRLGVVGLLWTAWVASAVAQLPPGTTPELIPAPSPLGYQSIGNLGLGALICKVDFECDDQLETLVGLDFFYFGQRYDQVQISTNGFLIVGGQSGDSAPVNQGLPDSAPPNNVLAPFWTDFDLLGPSGEDSGGGRHYFATFSFGQQDYYVFEWEQAQLAGGAGEEFTFQIWIEQGTSNIWFVYEQIPFLPANLTVGAENDDGSLGAAWHFNGTGPAPLVGQDLRLDFRLTLDFDQLPSGVAVTDQLPVARFASDPGFVVQTTAVDLGSSPPNLVCTVPETVGATCVNRLTVDFAPPVSGLTFSALGLKNPMAAAKVDIFENGNLSATVDIPDMGQGPSPPFTVFLPFFSNITRIEIYDINDTAGIGWDDFSFIYEPQRMGEMFADGFEGGNTTAWSGVQP